MQRLIAGIFAMLESFIYAVNTVLPIFVIVILGYILMQTGFINTGFTNVADRLVFKVALPVMLFLEVAKSGGTDVFDAKFILYCAGGIVATFLLLCAIVPLFVKSNDKRGAFIQGIYRSNFAILGIPLAESMFGEEGTLQIAAIMPFAITLFNVLAVVILSVYAPAEVKLTKKQLLKNILKTIATNPLIISVVLALPIMLLDITLPTVVNKSLTYLSNMVMPVALICIGATFRFDSLKQRFGFALSASLLKVMVVPLIMVSLAAAIGFRGSQLGVIMILFGGPTAVSSYIMAKNMKSDYELAGQIVLLTTLICMGTLFAGVFTLDLLGLI